MQQLVFELAHLLLGLAEIGHVAHEADKFAHIERLQKHLLADFPDALTLDGVRINSPHYLCKTVVDASTPRKLTLVVSQYEKSTTIFFTLRVYSTVPFTLRKIGDPYKHKTEVTNGKWSGRTAGGCANNRDTYPNNPRYQFTVDEDCHVLVELKGPKQYQIGFDVACVQAERKDSPLYFRSKSSGSYRSGFCVLALEVTAGTYDIIPTTYRPNQEGPFFLNVKSSIKLKLARLQ